MLEIFNVEPCKDHFQLGFLIRQRFSDLIRRRVAIDLILQHQLIPFAYTLQGKHLIDTLCTTNKKRFPRYWDELLGTAEGSGIPFLQIILMNFRKEILPFIPENAISDTASKDCSDVIVVNDSVAILGHNEDGNIALVGHTYLVRAKLQCGTTFTAYAGGKLGEANPDMQIDIGDLCATVCSDGTGGTRGTDGTRGSQI